MKILTQKEEILILQETKRLLSKNSSSYNYLDNSGLCYYMNRTYVNFEIYGAQIKGFTLANAVLLSKKYNFASPNGCVFWWTNKENWNEVRIQFIDALIEELKIPKVGDYRTVEHKLDVYYNPKYHGIHVVHSDNGRTVTIGDCCTFYNDAYSGILRYEVDKKYLQRLIKLDKENLLCYDFIELHEFSSTHHAISVSKEEDDKTYLFYKNNLLLKVGLNKIKYYGYKKFYC